MATENIPSRLHCVAEGNVVAGANEILDDDKGKKQTVINQENDQRLETLEAAVGTGGSVDSRIESAKTEIVGGASSDCNTLGKAEALISTNANDIAALQEAYAALTQNDVVVVSPSDTWPVATPAQNIIYRVVDRENTPPQYYTDYMWNGTVMVEMAQYNNAIDPRPKKSSQNLVTSGGVFDNMGALDVSELNATENPHTLAKYVDLSAALAAVPTDYQKGGMSIKFIQSSDNKYVQFRYMSSSTAVADFTNMTNWNDENIDKDDFVTTQEYRKVIAKNVVDTSDEYYIEGKIIKDTGDYYDGYSNYVTTGFISCKAGDSFRPANKTSFAVWACFYDRDKNSIPSAYISGQTMDVLEIPDNADIAYMRVSMSKSDLGECLYNTSELFNVKVGYNEYVLKVSKINGYDGRITTLETKVALNSHEIENLKDFKNAVFARNVYNPNDTDVLDHTYIKNDGTYESESSVFTTGYIPCKAGDVFAFEDGYTTSNICAVYDSEKNFIRTYYEGELNPYNTIPNDNSIAFVRFCPARAYMQKALYDYAGIIFEHVGYNNYIAFIDNIVFSNHMALRSSLVNRLSNLFDKDSQNIVDRSIIWGNGTIDSQYPGYLVTDFIPALAGEKFRLANQDTNWSTWWCWYDKNKTYIGGYDNHSDGKYILVPDNDSIRYIRVTIKYDDFGTMSDIALYKTDEYIDMVKPFGEEFVFNLDIVYPQGVDVQKDIYDLKLNVGIWKYACDKIVCIGDSLTHGLYPIKPPYRYLEQGYPYYLGRMLNTSVSNQGRSGGYPSAVINEVLPNITLTDYNVFMLWLGTNGGLRITDSPISQFERPQPEYQYLSYKTLIETIQAGNTDCKIFIGSVFVTGKINESYPQASVEETNTAIQSLATEYGLLKIDFSDLTYANYPKLHAGVNDTHFGKAGNIFVADRVCRFYEQYFSEDILRCEFGLQSID